MHKEGHNMKKVGIIGASGKIGLMSAKALEGSCCIKGGSRNYSDSFKGIENFEWQQVDIYDDDSLDKFCDGCDIILNCTGPAGIVKERVAVAAGKMGIPYVDTADVILVDKSIRDALPQNSVYVAGAGYVPGLGGLLIKYISEKLFDRVDKVKCYQVGKQCFSSIAFTDIVLTSFCGTVKLVSAGGPTETTLWNILHDVEESDLAEETIPYGKPIANNRYYILNENMQQVPLGVTGTLYGAGIGVSSGYFADEELTQKRFIKWNKELLYNTGDRGHYREDGTIIFDGREDQQVKVNGKRIELSAISSTAESAEHVEQAAAIVNSRNQIVLFYTGVETLTDEIRAVLESKLPDYMMPKAFIYLDKIPLTINGKVDKKSLASIYETSSKNKDKKVTDNGEMSELEILLRDKFCELLNLSGDEIDLDSDFFAMGGNSLIAMKLLSQLRETFDVDISLTDLFMTSTIREMKELLEERNAIIKK